MITINEIRARLRLEPLPQWSSAEIDALLTEIDRLSAIEDVAKVVDALAQHWRYTDGEGHTTIADDRGELLDTLDTLHDVLGAGR